jgi:UDP-glucuronate 4-epimerase
MLEGKPVPIFGDGSTSRDYTHVDDIVTGIRAAMDYDASEYEIINLGNNRTVGLLEMAQLLAAELGVSPTWKWCPMQAGDVPRTCADISKAEQLLGYRPATTFEDGVRSFIRWLHEESSLRKRSEVGTAFVA